MDLLFPDDGLIYQLKSILSSTVNYHLFTNNVVPTLSTVLSGLTEAAWSGYAPIGQNWSDFTMNGVAGHNGYGIAPPITFSNSSGSPVTAYGYYVTDTTNTILLAIALFDSAPITIAAGGTWNVVPIWGDFSGLSS
jgi:hypothetical protein